MNFEKSFARQRTTTTMMATHAIILLPIIDNILSTVSTICYTQWDEPHQNLLLFLMKFSCTRFTAVSLRQHTPSLFNLSWTMEIPSLSTHTVGVEHTHTTGTNRLPKENWYTQQKAHSATRSRCIAPTDNFVTIHRTDDALYFIFITSNKVINYIHSTCALAST